MQLTTKESSDGRPRPRPRAKASGASARSDPRYVGQFVFFPLELIFSLSAHRTYAHVAATPSPPHARRALPQKMGSRGHPDSSPAAR